MRTEKLRNENEVAEKILRYAFKVPSGDLGVFLRKYLYERSLLILLYPVPFFKY
jgi:hypothetical protein